MAEEIQAQIPAPVDPEEEPPTSGLEAQRWPIGSWSQVAAAVQNTVPVTELEEMVVASMA